MHACGSYQTDEGDTVRLMFNINKYWIIVMQVLLVTGGRNDNWRTVGQWTAIDSTEVMEEGGTWRLTSPLPSARAFFRAAVVDNNIFLFGDKILSRIT